MDHQRPTIAEAISWPDAIGKLFLSASLVTRDLMAIMGLRSLGRCGTDQTIATLHRHRLQSWGMNEMTIRTVETSPGVYAQGDLLHEWAGKAMVKDGDTVHTGKLVKCVKPCTKDAGQNNG